MWMFVVLIWFFLFVLSRSLYNGRLYRRTKMISFTLLTYLSWRHFFVHQFNQCEISWKFCISSSHLVENEAKLMDKRGRNIMCKRTFPNLFVSIWWWTKHSILLNLVPGNAPNQYQGSNWGGQDGMPQASGYGGRNGNQGGMNSYNGNQGGGGGFRGSQSGGGYNNNNRRFNNRDQPMHAPGGTRFDSRFENERDR